MYSNHCVLLRSHGLLTAPVPASATAPTSEEPDIAPAPEVDGEQSAVPTSAPETTFAPEPSQGEDTTTMKSSATGQTFPPLPYLYDVGPAWLFFGLQAIGGINAPDVLPDPAIRFLNQGPASLVITRYTNGPFGPWDQVCRGNLISACRVQTLYFTF